jgi:GAF domain-containing protein
MTDYKTMIAMARSLVRDVPHLVTRLANLAALIWNGLDDINWAGFYILDDDGSLYLGPFQGKVACTYIAPGCGVCGAAAETAETVVVPDVHVFPGHIACDADSRSEIVVPVFANGSVVGVLDIDSPIPDRFSQTDRIGLEGLIEAVEDELFFPEY